jgi:hypothetical protein
MAESADRVRPEPAVTWATWAAALAAHDLSMPVTPAMIAGLKS